MPVQRLEGRQMKTVLQRDDESHRMWTNRLAKLNRVTRRRIVKWLKKTRI